MSGGAFFRAGVGVVIRDDRKRILIGRRVGARDNAWQLPQGGINSGETPRQALYRELAEEVGLHRRRVRIEAELADWLVYLLPQRYRNDKVGWGQVQKWFLCSLRGRAAPVADQVEFAELRWVGASTLIAGAVSFRRAVYARLVEAWRL